MLGSRKARGYKETVATPFPQLDADDVRATAVREMCKPPICFLLSQAVIALRHLAGQLLKTRPQWIIRETRDQPGYWAERVYSHSEVARHLQKTWGSSVKQIARPGIPWNTRG